MRQFAAQRNKYDECENQSERNNRGLFHLRADFRSQSGNPTFASCHVCQDDDKDGDNTDAKNFHDLLQLKFGDMLEDFAPSEYHDNYQPEKKNPSPN
jgi:hypothetical protein